MNTCILLAAGASQRAKTDKLWADFLGQPLWLHTFEALRACAGLDEFVVVARAGDVERVEALVGGRARVVEGGASWMESFLKGAAASRGDILMVHNAANPWVTKEEVAAVLQVAREDGAAGVSQPVFDTAFLDGKVVDRSKLRLMQTPQAVTRDLFGRLDWGDATDLMSVASQVVKLRVLEASPRNRKITVAEDLLLANARSFVGEDSHKFSESGVLRLGGLELSTCPAMEANSDGDVVLHAIGRALAQAKGVRFSEIADGLVGGGERDSAAYLKPLLDGVKIVNVSVQIEAAKPRIDELPLAQSIGKILGMDRVQVSAMSGEGLTAFGRGEGIRALAIVTIA